MGSQGQEDHHYCGFCHFQFANKSLLESHMRTHTRERLFLCDQCKRGLSSNWHLREHIRTVHQGIKTVYEKKYKCFLCPYATYAKGNFDSHTRAHLGERSFPCPHPDCQYAATTSGSLRSHEINKHEKKRAFMCSFPNCGYRGKTTGVLNMHLVKHSEKRPFACNVEGCSYRSKRKGYLRTHKLYMHNGGLKPFACTSCNYSSTTIDHLREHQLSHTKEKRIKCHWTGCTFQAKHRLTLNRHLRHHEANLGCPLEGCGYVTHSCSILKRHMQLHDPTGRPFPCPLCPKYFFLNGHLSQHLKTHLQEKPFQCPACDFGSRNKGSIIQHVGSFHPNISSKFDQDSICDHCNVNFGCAFGLAMHRTKLKTAVVVITRLQLET